MRPLELWAGHECSVNRLHDHYADQTVLSGHERRKSDLALFASLGIKALRYPIVWERVAPDAPDRFDFAWSDERMEELRRLKLRPIAGLLHHGSGPRYTSLLDPKFPELFAAYARAVAERYPWIELWNPVNEPLTTARFSCLMGAWYPHRQRDDAAFWRALLNQVLAVSRAMREIRAVQPNAQLIQTDDLGFSYATPEMAQQAEFENERRWITWDLLFGRVVPGHPLWARIAGEGFHRDLDTLAADPCRPDLVGVNYYAASERFLDHRLGLYPQQNLGADGPGTYINVDAVRSLERGMAGVEAMLAQAWDRYQRPVAVTESHNVGTRDESMRWILEAWRAAESLRRDGVEIVSVTAWSLLGAFDWKTLGAAEAHRYEPGVFDLKSGEPRPTAIVGLLRALAAGRDPADHVAFAGAGWWRRDVRFEHDTEGRKATHVRDIVPAPKFRTSAAPVVSNVRPILVTGSTGTLGRAFAMVCERRALPFVATDRTMLRLEALDTIRATLDRVEPCAVINAAGFASLNDAELHPVECRDANEIGPGNLARACNERGLPLITFSSDMVFDGAKGEPYLETDELRPLNEYGRSKAAGERRVLAAGGRSLIVRAATFFSAYESNNFAVRLLRDLAEGVRPRFASDRFMSPTYVPDLVDAVLDLLVDGESGIWHVTNTGRISWADFARTIAEAAGYDPSSVEAAPAETLGWRAVTGVDLSLGSLHGGLLSEIGPAVGRFLADTRHAPLRHLPHPQADQRDPVVYAEAG